MEATIEFFYAQWHWILETSGFLKRGIRVGERQLLEICTLFFCPEKEIESQKDKHGSSGAIQNSFIFQV